MIKEHRRTFRVLRIALDLGLVTAAYYALYGFSVKVANPLNFVVVHPDYPFRLPAILAACWLMVFAFGGGYHDTRLADGRLALRRSLQVLALMLVVFAVGLFAFKVQHLSRKFMFSYFLASGALLYASRLAEISLLRLLRRLGVNTLSVVMVGGGPGAARVYEEFQRHREWGYRVVGAISAGGARMPPGLRRLGGMKDLREVLRTRIVDELVFSGPLAAGRLKSVLAVAEAAGVRVRVAMEQEADVWSVGLDHLGSLPFLTLSQNAKGPYQRLFKEVFDWLGALALLILLSPALLLVAACIFLTMGRPVLFKQKRMGFHGRVFFLYKFRTMVLDASRLQARLRASNEMSGPVFKIKDDPRVTPLGRFLRKWTLDEWPQLLNVLRGELSLVGPRPLYFFEARRVPAWAWRRFSVKPGLTCFWQVMGRNKIGFEDWMRLDLRYVDQWSFFLDLKLLALTVPALLFRKGAY